MSYSLTEDFICWLQFLQKEGEIPRPYIITVTLLSAYYVVNCVDIMLFEGL